MMLLILRFALGKQNELFVAALSRAVDGCSFMSLVLLFILAASQSDNKRLQYPAASVG
jgi:hypothetical protein